MGSSEANRMAYLLSKDDSVSWLGPVSHPYEWTQAVDAARAVTIEAARRSRTVTYGELRLAAYKATDMMVGHNQFAGLAMGVNRPGDKCLLSAIIVGANTGLPGMGFLPFARREGFDQPLPTLQRMVFEHFKLDRE